MAREWNKRPSRDLVFWWWRLGRLLMGMLMSRCLLTDRNFSTGINADSLRFPENMDRRTLSVLRAKSCWETQ
jgi:hypothetical protein